MLVLSVQDLFSPYAKESPEVTAISTELSEEELEIVFQFILSGILPENAALLSPVFRQLGVCLEALDLVQVSATQAPPKEPMNDEFVIFSASP